MKRLGPAEAAIFETFVVPRYLSSFGELALEMLADGNDAQVIHLDCRTGYPDRGLALRLPGSYIYGCDPSPHAIELARAKAATMPDMISEYRVVDGLPVPYASQGFSHALTLHPLAAPEARTQTIAEFARVLAPRGQALLAMPLRGSFQEIADLLREFALKTESPEMGRRVESAVQVRPTVEMLGAELEDAGFGFVDVEQRTMVLSYRGGRDFFEDPVTRLLILPELRVNLGSGDLTAAFNYVENAIDRYWSDSSFELTVQVGCASGRRS
ncbi:MAG TPA: class I SAM-dependent methyltransferase [Polyangiaceae bacterium]|jgi:SAM-dependent methyltransferase